MQGAEAAAAQQVRLGELWVDRVGFAQALERVAALVAARQGGVVVTPNVDHVVLAEEDPAFHAAYAGASLVLADGKPLLWAARLLGHPLPEKVSGSDLTWPLLERAAKDGWRVFLLGAGPGIAERLAARVKAELGLAVVGTLSPRVGADGAVDAATLETLRAAAPDLVLVALGSPKQEIFCHRAAPHVRPAVFLGVGATFDFLVGEQVRAPAWMSHAGLEWLYRLGQDPKRMWRRYLVRDPKFVLSFWPTLRLPREARTRARGT